MDIAIYYMVNRSMKNNCIYKVSSFCENPNIKDNMWGWKLCIFHKHSCVFGTLNSTENFSEDALNFLNKLKEY